MAMPLLLLAAAPQIWASSPARTGSASPIGRVRWSTSCCSRTCSGPITRPAPRLESSHDRNANLETNYLLQRLDSFTGIAILTTNFGNCDRSGVPPPAVRASAVPAARRTRARAAVAHAPAALPIADELNLAELARRYPLTGGYIRNAVLRAAYAAAGRGTPLSSADLEHAVRAEYLSRGKVSTTGAIT
jgi:hypothetical protein